MPDVVHTLVGVRFAPASGVTPWNLAGAGEYCRAGGEGGGGSHVMQTIAPQPNAQPNFHAAGGGNSELAGLLPAPTCTSPQSLHSQCMQWQLKEKI